MHYIIFTSHKVGYADIFLAVTCNLQCPEIRNALLLHRNFVERCHFVRHVFFKILRAVTAFIIEKLVYGGVRASSFVTEFQNRGLPRAFCILFCVRASKSTLIQLGFVINIISAEVPNIKNELQRKVLLTHNLCNLCSQCKPCSAFMSDLFCTKRFPKEFWRRSDSINHRHLDVPMPLS